MNTLARLLYQLLLLLLLPVLLLLLYKKSQGAPIGFAQRLGFIRQSNTKDCIHIHAASMGEVVAVTPLVKELQLRYPNSTIIFTTTTGTGADKVKETFSSGVEHYYLPIDFSFSVQRFLTAFNPKISLFVELELWPNFINSCSVRGIPVVAVNARMTDKSAASYRKFGSLFKTMIQQLVIVLTQSDRDSTNYLSLGLPEKKLLQTGNLKFDLSIDELTYQQATEQKTQFSTRPVLVAGSTHEKDEVELLPAYKKLLEQFPDLLLIIVPRHPHRFDLVNDKLLSLQLKVARRSQQQLVSNETQVLLGDTMGELRLWYGCGDFTFVGGAIEPRGGHNPLESAAFSIPVIMGPNTENCKEIAEQLKSVGALHTVNTSEEIVEQVSCWLNNPQATKLEGEKAKQVVLDNQGALTKTLLQLDSILS